MLSDLIESGLQHSNNTWVMAVWIIFGDVSCTISCKCLESYWENFVPVTPHNSTWCMHIPLTFTQESDVVCFCMQVQILSVTRALFITRVVHYYCHLHMMTHCDNFYCNLCLKTLWFVYRPWCKIVKLLSWPCRRDLWAEMRVCATVRFLRQCNFFWVSLTTN